MELIRDPEREERVEFLYRGIPIKKLMAEPEVWIAWCREHLSTTRGTDESTCRRKSRWQYTIGLCQQIIAAREQIPPETPGENASTSLVG